MMGDWLPSGPSIGFFGIVDPPPGWQDFLDRRPDLSMGAVLPARVAMTAARFLRLAQVQAGVNMRVGYRRDLGDRWEVADTQGDCEDYALAKLVRLLGYGWPRGALRLAMCRIVGAFKRPAHAVLQVETDHGTWVLDNRMKYPRLWTRMPYRWLARERPGGTAWERLAPPKALPKTR